jgi:hypothetical protein
MSSLSVVADPVPTNLDVTVSVEDGIVTTTPATLTVPPTFDGTITWSLSGASFLMPPITFGGQNPPSFEVSQTTTTVVRRWGNTMPLSETYSYYYTLHMVTGEGQTISHDPTVENIPPTT